MPPQADFSVGPPGRGGGGGAPQKIGHYKASLTDPFKSGSVDMSPKIQPHPTHWPEVFQTPKLGEHDDSMCRISIKRCKKKV